MLQRDVEDLEPLTPAMFLGTLEVGVPELDQIDVNKLNKRLVYRNRIQKDLRKRFRVEYLGQLREIRSIKGENTLGGKVVTPRGDGENKSSVRPTNSPLFSDAREGSHLSINIDPELSKPQSATTSSMQPCSVFLMVELDWSPELRQVDTSRQKPLRCSPVPVFLMVELD
ncbi:hypothetical protein TNIN_440441 [Trichonephila inaurata madagascariensis]|uniref:Uncharacterized protein n=1 Tax=Trichonephila inaurata madagascariensis TaxID=2747483 RepID=A0A8X7CNA8_9ARAC|nr:hypothetical protein TNIN_440441 [Trichonephila inaurata madagascariensis]